MMCVSAILGNSEDGPGIGDACWGDGRVRKAMGRQGRRISKLG
jgi:hypothetical protein